jgi:hypothetical protein
MAQIKVLPLSRMTKRSITTPIPVSLSAERIVNLLEIHPEGPRDRFIESIPFSLNDTTAGTENELQAVVSGWKDDVDLAITIEQSNYYANITRRIQTGDTSKRLVSDLERFLDRNSENVWENSWVRFSYDTLSPYVQQVFEQDLLADKRNPTAGYRGDVSRFVFEERGETRVRIPISYLLKLSLAQVIGRQPDLPNRIRSTGERLLCHFLSDNTSPETYSFHVVPLRLETGMGKAVARETSRRFLLTQLLTFYANDAFRLRTTGQEVLIYCAPHPPVRQKELNSCISDAFYRELFMSPCLSGWDRGEEKHAYMALCHRVLSRSHLNAVAKMREAGIITRNLVVLPSTSNISLANNGIHLSLGSHRLTERLKDPSSGFGAPEEKFIGDLVIKIVEHFLPLLVGTYSASPYRLDFQDLHPERALGFLPHELDYTHLRMIWRRWKKKFRCKVFGNPVTPFGPEWVDRVISAIIRFKGDMIPDFRLIDYFVALMSTERSPVLDGRLGNADRLKQDLADLGVFDPRMATYMLYRLREYAAMGFSGFEGRTYSIFPSLSQDLGRACDLQMLMSAFAFKVIAEGKVGHAHIPDIPFVESERRQIFFGTAIGIPTFYVRKDTVNQFLRRIVEKAERVRSSRRYPGYLRVHNLEYRKALVRILREEAGELIELMGLHDMLQHLQSRVEGRDGASATEKLTGGILGELSAASPFSVDARQFNAGAERYYRGTLRKQYLLEAIEDLSEDIRKISEQRESDTIYSYSEELHYVLGHRDASDYIDSIKKDLLEGSMSHFHLQSLIYLVLISLHYDSTVSKNTIEKVGMNEDSLEGITASIHRAEHW